MGLAIDPMSAASPDLSQGDLSALMESIRTIGQLVPIVLYQGRVIDGRKRWRACEALGLEPKTVTIPEDATATDFAHALNLVRTHYSAGQRAMYAAKLANIAHGKNRLRTDEPSIDSSSAGQRFGVSEASVNRARRIRRKAIADVIGAVERDELRLHTAVEIAELPKEEQGPLLRKAVEAKTAGRKLPAGTLRSGAKYKALPKRPTTQVLQRLLDGLEHSAAVLEEFMFKPADEVPTEQWIKQLDGILRVLRGFRTRLRGGV